jgi:hypothetical protein
MGEIESDCHLGPEIVSLDQVSTCVDQLPDLPPCPDSHFHLHPHRPSILDVLASWMIWAPGLGMVLGLGKIFDYPYPVMQWNRSGRKPFVVFDFLASFGMGAVIDS